MAVMLVNAPGASTTIGVYANSTLQGSASSTFTTTAGNYYWIVGVQDGDNIVYGYCIGSNTETGFTAGSPSCTFTGITNVANAGLADNTNALGTKFLQWGLNDVYWRQIPSHTSPTVKVVEFENALKPAVAGASAAYIDMGGPAGNMATRHDLEFKRVRFVNGHPHATGRDPQLLYYHTAWITEAGVAHLPDNDLHAMELEDRIALDEILRELPSYPPFKR